MAYRTSNYSDYLTRICGLMGVDPSTLTAEEDAAVNGFFNRFIRRIWRYDYWTENTIIEQRTPNGSYFIDYDQASETPIGEVFNVWSNSPTGNTYPREVAFVPQASGIQLVGVTSASDVYVYYRTRLPVFTGADYSASATYSSGTTVYFTTAAGAGNYYKANASTSAGQSPENTPAKWDIQSIPYSFFEYVVHAAYADWLRSEGQGDKAVQADLQAEELLKDECDILQRQQTFIPPTKFQTHLKGRPTY